MLTALHVVDGAESITVSFSDGTNAAATIDESNPESDIATLRPQRLPDTVVPAVLGGGVQVGSPVFAVGHPLGLTDSLSAGVVSALDRTVTVEGDRKLEDLIQFDAAVNPGNSGGPLLNKAGQVVGIVTGLANPSDQTPLRRHRLCRAHRDSRRQRRRAASLTSTSDLAAASSRHQTRPPLTSPAAPPPHPLEDPWIPRPPPRAGRRSSRPSTR